MIRVTPRCTPKGKEEDPHQPPDDVYCQSLAKANEQLAWPPDKRRRERRQQPAGSPEMRWFHIGRNGVELAVCGQEASHGNGFDGA